MNNIYFLIRRPFLYRIFLWMLNRVPFAILLKRLRETDSLLAYSRRDPKPVYPFHVILIPKKNVRSFSDLEPADPFLASLVTAAQSLIAENHLKAYRLIVNGREYQNIPHLYFHLIPGTSNVQHPTFDF